MEGIQAEKQGDGEDLYVRIFKIRGRRRWE